MATIKDVAKAAGVSVGTVSRAFNGYTDINEDTRNRILLIAEALNYTPQLGAKNLSSKNKTGISLLFSDHVELSEIGAKVDQEYLFLLLMGACQFVEEQEKELAIYHTTAARQAQKSCRQFCIEHGIAGMICFGLRTNDSYFRQMADCPAKCVTIDLKIQGDNISTVLSDDESAMYDLTNAVLNKGYQRIIFLNGSDDTEVSCNRKRGIEKALAARGMNLRQQDVLMTNYQAERGGHLLRQYLKEHTLNEKTAVMCITDVVAVGVFRMLTMAGYRIGQDIGLTGFDGRLIADITIPPITTVAQNPKGKGYLAAKTLLAMMEGEKVQKEIYMPYSIIMTESI